MVTYGQTKQQMWGDGMMNRCDLIGQREKRRIAFHFLMVKYATIHSFSDLTQACSKKVGRGTFRHLRILALSPGPGGLDPFFFFTRVGRTRQPSHSASPGS